MVDFYQEENTSIDMYSTDPHEIGRTPVQERQDRVDAGFAGVYHGEPEVALEIAQEQEMGRGFSPTLENTKNNLKDEAEVTVDDLIKTTAAQGDIDATSLAIESREDLVSDLSDLRVNASEEAALRYEAVSGDTEYTNRYLERVAELSDIDSKVHRAIDMAIMDADTSGVSIAADLAGGLFLGDQLAGQWQTSEEILGEKYYALGGTMLKDLVAKAKDAPREERLRLAVEIIDHLKKNSKDLFMAGNDINAVAKLEEFREFYDSPNGDVALTRWLNDIFGVVEIAGAAPVTFLAKKGVKLTKHIFKAPHKGRLDEVADALGRSNPEEAVALEAAMLKSVSSDDTVEGAGDVLNRSVPGPLDDTGILLDGAPEEIQNSIKGIRSRIAEVDEFFQKDNTFMFFDQEYKAKEKKIRRTIKSGVESVVETPKMHFMRHPDKNALIYRSVFSGGDGVPMTLENANETIAKITKLNDEGVPLGQPGLYVRDEGMPTLTKYDPEVHTNPDGFFVASDVEAPMMQHDIMKINTATKAVGRLGRFLMASPESWLDRNILGANRVALKTRAMLGDELKRAAKPFYNLSGVGSQRRVISLLEEGDADQKVFTALELHDNGYTKKEIDAYYAARFINDAVWRQSNLKAREELVQGGWKSLSIQTGPEEVFENAFRQLPDNKVPENIKEVYDPITKSAVSVDNKLTADLQKNAKVIGKLRTSIDVNGNEVYNYAIVRKSHLRDIPDQVFPYHKGYVYRHNEDPYFIDATASRKVDGTFQEKTRTLKTARNAAEAQKAVDKLNAIALADKTGEVFSYRVDRSLDPTRDALRQDQESIHGGKNNVWYSKRGDRMTREDGSESAVEEPMRAMNRMISAVANVHAHSDLVNTLTTRHQKTYGSLKVQGKPIWQRRANGEYEFNRELALSADESIFKKAVSEYDYMVDIKHIPSPQAQVYKRLLTSLDKRIGKLGNEKLSAISKKTLLDIFGSTDPDTFLRTTTFTLAIAMAPFRHLLLQSVTGAHLMGINPKFTIQSAMATAPQMVYLAMPAGKTTDAIVDRLFKPFASKGSTFSKEMKAWRESGVFQAIDSNMVIGESNFSWAKSVPLNATERVTNAVGKVAKSPFRALKLGFDTGELANQAFAWQFAKRMWVKNNPGKDHTTKSAMDEISNMTSSYAIDMTRANALGYQKGGFATATQFMAINQKMLVRMAGLDQVTSGKPLSKEHLGLIAGMLAMYGSAGVGLTEFYDSWSKESGVNIPPELDRLAYGGFTQVLYDTAFDRAFGEQFGTTRTTAARHLSPASGIFTAPVDFLKNIVEGKFSEVLLGPSANTMPNIKRTAEYLSDIWALRDIYSTPELTAMGLKRTVENFGSFSTMFKASAMMNYKDKIGEFYSVDKTGRPSVQYKHLSEVWSKGIFGIGSRGEDEFFDMHFEMHKKFNSSGKASQGEVDKEAKHLVKYMYEEYLKSPSMAEAREKISAISFALHGTIWGEAVRDRAIELFNLDANSTQFYQDLADQAMLFDSGKSVEALKNLFRHSDVIKEEDKKTLIEHIERTMGAIEFNKLEEQLREENL